jgi:thiamine phosphate synthase YjbQ (UPF0047 family)
MRSELRAVRTGGVPVVVDLTDECAEFVAQEGDGLLHVFVPHATAGLAILETGSGSDHVLPAFVPPHASVPVLEGRLMLGTWQRICLVDTNTDNHQRHVRFSFLAG